MAKKSNTIMDILGEKLFKVVTDAKVRVLYQRAKSDPELAAQLKSMETEFAELTVNLDKMKKLMKDI